MGLSEKSQKQGEANMAKQVVWALLVTMCFGLVLEGACGDAVDGTCKSVVETYGYPCQEYNVTTKDGYILSMQRIPHGRSNIAGNRQPVLLQHGLTMDGMTWLMSTPDQSLAYILADNGFDVWISNTRGTRWSRGHTSLQANDPAYWDWSWEELVQYDLPSFTQFVHKQTGQKMHYVGHSLGTLTVMASLSQGNLTDLLKSAALLSPIAHLNHITTPFRVLTVPLLGESSFWLAVPEFNPTSVDAIAMLLKTLCDSPGVNCFDILSTVTGMNCCLNSSTVDFFLKYWPQSTATKNMIHLAQMVRSGNIAKYDYEDPIQNVHHYGQNKPPTYNMSSIPKDFPLFLSSGGMDALSDTEDVNILDVDLKSHDGDKLTVQKLQDYAHVDFIMAFNAKQKVYDPMIGFFNSHSNP